MSFELRMVVTYRAERKLILQSHLSLVEMVFNVLENYMQGDMKPLIMKFVGSETEADVDYFTRRLINANYFKWLKESFEVETD